MNYPETLSPKPDAEALNPKNPKALNPETLNLKP